MQNKMIKEGLSIKLYFIITFLGFIGLSFFFPYTGDDWAWGSSIGMDRLANFFDDYNGRYLGNLVVLLLTRSNVLRILIMGLVIFLIIKIATKIVNRNSKEVFIMMVLLVLGMPSGIFSQAIVWTSGFSNYAISMLLTLICLNMCLFESVWKKAAALQYIIVFLLAISSALFVENMTLFNLFVSGVMVLFSIFKKRLNLIHLAFVLGTVIGTGIMFSNGAYLNIANNTDHYRTVSFSIIGMIKQAINNYAVTIYKDMSHNTIFLNIVTTVLFLVIARKNQSTIKLKLYQKRISQIALYVMVSYTIYTLLCAINPEWNLLINSQITTMFEGVFALIYIFSIPVLIYLHVSDIKRRNRMLLELVGAGMIILPLFIVSPIGSRCFFAPYILLSILACEALDIILKDVNETHKKVILSSISIVAIFMFANIFSIFSNIHISHKEQLSYIKTQVNNGAQQVTLEELPYGEYIWNESPTDNESLQMRYKLFFGIDENIELIKETNLTYKIEEE
jgi:hypothetical protein